MKIEDVDFEKLNREYNKKRATFEQMVVTISLILFNNTKDGVVIRNAAIRNVVINKK